MIFAAEEGKMYVSMTVDVVVAVGSARDKDLQASVVWCAFEKSSAHGDGIATVGGAVVGALCLFAGPLP